MDRWASLHTAVNFLCICVIGSDEARQLARSMGQEMKLRHCVNGFVDSEENLPSYGQLGCGGFIVFDKQMQLVAAKTSAFMQVRQLAFKHVEGLLDTLLTGAPAPAAYPGEILTLSGLKSSPKLNGQQGVVIGAEGDRLQLALGNGRQLKVKPENCLRDGEPADGGGCCGDACSSADAYNKRRRGEIDNSSACDSKGSCDNNGSCGTRKNCDNGCDNACGTAKEEQEQHEEEDNTEPLQLLQGVASVSVPSMDAEHEECVQLLNELMQQRSTASLQALYDYLQEHFEHEEQLFKQHGFGGGGGKFSAAESHKKEHERMLRTVQQQLGNGGQTLSKAFVKSVVEDFVEHAEKYDSKYTSHMVAVGAH